MLPRSLVLAAALSCLVASAAEAQSFGIGVGGAAVNDTGTASNVKGFRNGEGHAFVEMVMEPGVALQLRGMYFTVPGTTADSPSVRGSAALVSVGYQFREEWFRAGFFAGGGLYRMNPHDPEPDQTASDVSEDVFGWHGGVLTTFKLAPAWDLRLEASVHSIRTGVTHAPIFIGGSIGYLF